MTVQTALAPWVRRFLLEHLVTERNLLMAARKGTVLAGKKVDR